MESSACESCAQVDVEPELDGCASDGWERSSAPWPPRAPLPAYLALKYAPLPLPEAQTRQ
jgi:hypothetical protein